VTLLGEVGCHSLAYVLASNYKMSELVGQLRSEVNPDSLQKWAGQPLRGLEPVCPDESAWPMQEVVDQADILIEMMRK
jgi:hypothetical protein